MVGQGNFRPSLMLTSGSLMTPQREPPLSGRLL